MDIDMEAVLQKAYEYLAQYGLKVIAALIILLIGRWLAKFISRLIKKALIITAKVKLALDENGIAIPYPQRDVHIKGETN